jgi:hypothetical protein
MTEFYALRPKDLKRVTIPLIASGVLHGKFVFKENAVLCV